MPPLDSNWQERVARTVETMRAVSLIKDPQEVVREYAKRMRWFFPTDGFVSLSRRGLEKPFYRITRSTLWTDEVNPWKQPERLPLFRGGFLADLIYAENPVIIDDFQPDPSDPAFEFIRGHRSLMAIPHFHEGHALNMVAFMRREPGAFPKESFHDNILSSNLFGRATYNLVLSEQLKAAYDALDREMMIVGEIQRSLLPPKLPDIPGVELAAHYQTSKRAGGDYYDVFPLGEGKFGLLIADVSGHGTPAAVLMAITHAIAHSFAGEAHCPGEVLSYINRRLADHYLAGSGNFVTAFYAVYDSTTRTLAHANAGHPPPRFRRGSEMSSVDGNSGIPLGISSDEKYAAASLTLQPGDRVILYTDGLSEAFSPQGRMFGSMGLDRILATSEGSVQDLNDDIIGAVGAWTNDSPPTDDRTLLSLRVR